MIRYTLKCVQDHTFDSWFPSSGSFEAQKERGLVSCPSCGTTQVEKAVMAPAVSRTDRQRRAPEQQPQSPQAPAQPPAPAAEPPTSVAIMSEQEHAFRTLLRELRDHVTSTADYVGDSFADMARQMHDGTLEHRSIYGEATSDELKALREDEVEVFPLPVLPEDRN